MKMQRSATLVLIVLVWGATSATAHAYVDPNAGGLLFQLLTPLLALSAATVAFARRQLARSWLFCIQRVRELFDRRAGGSRQELD
jgi:hypothetical protein